jgi:hypothetical protein
MCVLTPADSLCCVWFIYLVVCCFWCREVGSSSIKWAPLRRILFMPEDRDKVQSPKRFKIKNKTMDTVQKVNNCFTSNIPSSQTFRIFVRESCHTFSRSIYFLTERCTRITDSVNFSA